MSRYTVLDVEMNRAQCEWSYVDAPEQRDASLRQGSVWLTRTGENHLQQGVAHSAPPSNVSPLAP